MEQPALLNKGGMTLVEDLFISHKGHGLDEDIISSSQGVDMV